MMSLGLRFRDALVCIVHACGLIAWGFSATGTIANAQEPEVGKSKQSQVRQDDAKWVESVDRLVEQAMEAGKMPGCVIGFGSSQGLTWSKAYGLRSVEPTPEPMTLDTIFDMASITKPVATATGVMHLIESGLIRLDAQASEYLPEFGREGKKEIR
jgi:CubicO group peptidase (beta-lactamase class C family)